MQLHNSRKQLHLLNIEIGGELQLGVDCPSLHKSLGSKQDFSTWIKRRISQCQFRENFDFVSLHQKVERDTIQGHQAELNISLPPTWQSI